MRACARGEANVSKIEVAAQAKSTVALQQNYSFYTTASYENSIFQRKLDPQELTKIVWQRALKTDSARKTPIYALVHVTTTIVSSIDVGKSFKLWNRNWWANKAWHKKCSRL